MVLDAFFYFRNILNKEQVCITIIILTLLKGLFTRKSDFALGLQFYNTNNIFLFTKMD